MPVRPQDEALKTWRLRMDPGSHNGRRSVSELQMCTLCRLLKYNLQYNRLFGLLKPQLATKRLLSMLNLGCTDYGAPLVK